jgi:hypothetical protein
VNISNYLVLGKTSPLTYQVRDSAFTNTVKGSLRPNIIKRAKLALINLVLFIEQVLGHMKTVLILVLGFTVFNVRPPLRLRTVY